MFKKLLVSEWMASKLFTVDQEDSTQKAFYLLKSNHVRFLPVLHQRELVGVVTDRDIRLAEHEAKVHGDFYNFNKPVPVKTVMTYNPIVLLPSDNLEAAACLMVEKKIGGFPIVAGAHSKQVIGVLTVSDVMRALIHVIHEKKL